MINNKCSLQLPFDEVEITTSRSGGPGGQHVNKSDTKVTLRWNLYATKILTDEQKDIARQNLATQLTIDGDLLVSVSESRSQLENKKRAFALLTEKIEKALYVPKKRRATKASRASKEKRLQSKKQHSAVKALRKNKRDYE